MSHRLKIHGRALDRSKPLHFTFNGKVLEGFQGDTLASALLANDHLHVGRSFKYHRPRGVVASGPEEPNALMNLGEGRGFEPNARATTTELFDGLTARSQNHWPSLNFDIGALNNLAARVLPAGFYYKTFIHPRFAWKHLFEPFIRRSAGLGQAPTEPDADRYEQLYLHVDVLVVGGGLAGLKAAEMATMNKRVLVLEQSNHWGGRASTDNLTVEGKSAIAWTEDTVAKLSKSEHVTLRLRTMCSGLYDHGYVLAYERVADHSPGDKRPRHRLWRIRAKQIIVATGAIERPLSFAGNDIPGVMLASAIRDYVAKWAVAPGKRTVIVTNNDDAYRTAITLHAAGLEVPAIVDARPEAKGALPEKARALGVRVITGAGIAKVKGGKRVRAVVLCAQSGTGEPTETLACDAVAMSGGWSPVVHLWSHCGGKLIWDEEQAMFRPDPDRPPKGHDGESFVRVVGSANGHLHSSAVYVDAFDAGLASVPARFRMTPPKVEPSDEAPIAPVWKMPEQPSIKLRSKTWLDFQNDVKVSDIELAAREGYESVEHAKRYTTLGMATDQGKLSNINGLAILADARGEQIPQVGTTTFRPPYTPISMGVIAGEAHGTLFQPIRRTPLHSWHEENGAYWEPVGLWRRPYCYPQNGENHAQAVVREINQTRNAVGLLDASTLGKILVKGPDAGRFLDMLYTNMISSLPIGKCRYGLMCNENGFLIDDGVVARLDEDTFLCHTTTGGADHIHAHMEDWLQCEWWDWKVYTTNLTEQYAQIAVVGPKAREVLEKIGGMDVSKSALPFMEWREGLLGGFRARVFRISFSGELSYEIAVPASDGLAFWNTLIAAGAEFGIMPYGTEALHVLRAEKGFIMIGDETDGTVIPQDLGLGWAISKKKQDYLGKRAQQRPDMTRLDRWRLVGLESLSGDVLPEGGYIPGQGENANGQRNVIGRVTSTYYSPTLDRGIAMALIVNGPDRMGEVVEVWGGTGEPIKAKIVTPVFFDPNGDKQNV